MKIRKFDYNRILISSIILLCSTIFISGISHDVNYAEAAPADAINDLALQSITSYKSDRNNITLSWSVPNDNGGAISQYVVQLHNIPGNDWITKDNNVQGTIYTHENAPTGYQFSYRVWAISSDGCVGPGNMRNDVIPGCNESNILHVVSLPNGEYGAPISQCENKKLDDCGYFPDDTFTIDEIPAPTTPAPTTPAPTTPAPKEQPPSSDQWPSVVIFSVVIAAMIIYSSFRYTRRAKRNLPAWYRTKERTPIDGKVKNAVFKRANYRCQNKSCNKTWDEAGYLQIDHIKPVSRGGTDDLSNLQALCEECNKRKGNKYKGKGRSYH